MGIRYSSSSRVDPRVGDMTEETPVPDINFSDVGATTSSSQWRPTRGAGVIRHLQKEEEDPTTRVLVTTVPSSSQWRPTRGAGMIRHIEEDSLRQEDVGRRSNFGRRSPSEEVIRESDDPSKREVWIRHSLELGEDVGERGNSGRRSPSDGGALRRSEEFGRSVREEGQGDQRRQVRPDGASQGRSDVYSEKRATRSADERMIERTACSRDSPMIRRRTGLWSEDIVGDVRETEGRRGDSGDDEGHWRHGAQGEKSLIGSRQKDVRRSEEEHWRHGAQGVNSWNGPRGLGSDVHGGGGGFHRVELHTELGGHIVDPESPEVFVSSPGPTASVYQTAKGVARGRFDDSRSQQSEYVSRRTGEDGDWTERGSRGMERRILIYGTTTEDSGKESDRRTSERNPIQGRRRSSQERISSRRREEDLGDSGQRSPGERRRSSRERSGPRPRREETGDPERYSTQERRGQSSRERIRSRPVKIEDRREDGRPSAGERRGQSSRERGSPREVRRGSIGSERRPAGERRQSSQERSGSRRSREEEDLGDSGQRSTGERRRRSSQERSCLRPRREEAGDPEHHLTGERRVQSSRERIRLRPVKMEDKREDGQPLAGERRGQSSRERGSPREVRRKLWIRTASGWRAKTIVSRAEQFEEKYRKRREPTKKSKKTEQRRTKSDSRATGTVVSRADPFKKK